MRVTAFLLILALTGIYAQDQEEVEVEEGEDLDELCTHEDMDPCGFREGRSNLTEFPTKDYLDLNCRRFQDAASCHVNYIRKCVFFPGGETDEVYAEMDSIIEVANALCDEQSAFREDYLKYVSCYNSLMDEYGTCHKDIKLLLTQFRKHLPSGNNQTRIFHNCMKTPHVNCIVKRTADACGIEAAHTLSRGIGMLIDAFTALACEKVEAQILEDKFLSFLLNHSEEIQKMKSNFTEGFIA